MAKQLVKADNKGQLFLPGATWSPLGLIANKTITEEQLESAGQLIGSVHKRCMWAIGDYYRIKRERGWVHGEDYDDADAKFGLKYNNAARSKRVSEAVEISRRRLNLSWNHHHEVAPFEPKVQDEYLDLAEKNEWSVAELRKRIKADAPPVEVKDEPGKYRVIYADPPWQYGDERGTVAAGGAVAQYPLMSIEQLCNMNVCELAAKNAVLFMWVTVPLLAESMEVIDAWGFEYKTHIVWDKQRPFYGNYSHVQHEILCICTRGSCVPAKDCQLPRSVLAIKKGKHSEKPHEFYELIEGLYPKGKRIELFARNERDGWESWGNEINASA